MSTVDVNQINFVSGDSGTFAIYNDVYYKINDSSRAVIEELQKGSSISVVAAKFFVSDGEIEKLLEAFHKKKKGSILGRIVLFPKVACNFAGSTLQYLVGNNKHMLLFVICYILSCFYMFNYCAPVNSISIFQAFTVFFLILFWHELGHVAAAYKCGIRNLQIRLGFYLIFPVTHVDMNAVYTLTNKQRLLIDMAGLYFQMLLGIIFCVFSLISDNAFWALAFSENLMVIIYNLIPYQISDGHWMYSDYFGIDNLNSQSKKFAKSFFLFRTEKSGNKYAASIKVYSIFNAVFVSLLTVYSIVVLILRSFTFHQIYENLVTSHFAVYEVLKACWLLYPYCLLLIFFIVKINEYTKNLVNGKK